ncbi:MAG: hypothetical protein KGN02_14525 [bacterium]|nr:hypothetical protein [bacterium]
MLKRLASQSLVGLAVSASLFGCSRPAGPVSARNAELARTVGARLAAQAHERDARHRSELARLMRARVLSVAEGDRTMRIDFEIANLADKGVRAVDLAFVVERPSGARIAITELHARERLRPKSRNRVALVIPYIRFGDETGSMREAVGRPQRYRVDVEEIAYDDGSDAGYDD